MNSYFLILLILALFILVLIVIAFMDFINEFTRELKYINMEIKRTEGETKQFWIRKRRLLWLSLIPFFKG